MLQQKQMTNTTCKIRTTKFKYYNQVTARNNCIPAMKSQIKSLVSNLFHRDVANERKTFVKDT